MKKQDLDEFANAYTKDFQYHDENILTLQWYVRRLLTCLQESRKKYSLLSLGVGHEVVAQALLSRVGNEISSYSIVEGSQEIIERFRSKIDLTNKDASENFEAYHGYFEEFELPKSEKFDCIEMGFVLEHVDNPKLILQRFANMLKPDGRLFIAVPNAKSLHRRVGFLAGLLEDMFALSKSDLELGHQRYFDVDALTSLLEACGLHIVLSEGILLKPITTNQMKTLNFDAAILEALCQVGCQYPELSNSIFVEARLRSENIVR